MLDVTITQPITLPPGEYTLRIVDPAADARVAELVAKVKKTIQEFRADTGMLYDNLRELMVVADAFAPSPVPPVAATEPTPPRAEPVHETAEAVAARIRVLMANTPSLKGPVLGTTYGAMDGDRFQADVVKFITARDATWQAEVNDLEEARRLQYDEIARCHAELTAAVDHNAQKRDRIAELEAEAASFQRRLDGWQAKFDERDAKVARLEKDLAGAHEMQNGLVRDSKAYAATIQGKDDAITELEVELRTVKRELEMSEVCDVDCVAPPKGACLTAAGAAGVEAGLLNKELQFAYELADECDKHPTDFGKGRASGLRDLANNINGAIRTNAALAGPGGGR